MMTSEAAQEYVETLLDYQFDLLFKRQFGVNHAEFLFAETARELTQYPAVRAWFLELAENSMIKHGPTPGQADGRPKTYVSDDFLFYLAHLTRWPEFSALAQRMHGRPEDLWQTNLIHRWSDKLRSALRDDWEDRDFYEAFDGGPRV